MSRHFHTSTKHAKKAVAKASTPKRAFKLTSTQAQQERALKADKEEEHERRMKQAEKEILAFRVQSIPFLSETYLLHLEYS